MGVKVQVHVGVSLQELFDLVGLVCRQVVENHVNLLVGLTAGDNLFEEPDEFGAGVPLGSLALHLASLDVECRVQRQRAIASIFKAVPFQSSGRLRQHCIQARVEPSLGPSLMAASTFACSFGVLTEGCWPGCSSSVKPPMRCCNKRLFQRAIVGALVSNKS